MVSSIVLHLKLSMSMLTLQYIMQSGLLNYHWALCHSDETSITLNETQIENANGHFLPCNSNLYCIVYTILILYSNLLDRWTVEASPGAALDKAIEAIDEVMKQEEYVQVDMVSSSKYISIVANLLLLVRRYIFVMKC